VALRLILPLLVLTLALSAAASADTYSNNARIAILDAPIGQYPPPPGVTTATLQVSETSVVTSIRVVLMRIYHAESEDLDIAVISPNGTKVVLMSDAGKSPGPEPSSSRSPLSQIGPAVTLTFDDTAGQAIPATGPISTGTYRGADYGPNMTDPFCAGETDQSQPYTTTLSSFNGQPANGTWTLRIQDDCAGGDGEITGGWCVIVNSSSRPCEQTTAVAVSGFVARRITAGARLSWRTGEELNAAGFNLFRTNGKRSVKVNKTLVRAKRSGTSRGASYALTDRTAKRGVAYSYRLQAVETNGNRSWAAHAQLRARSTAVGASGVSLGCLLGLPRGAPAHAPEARFR
jgi:subtilisin-like proprotein convertase family protein